MFIFQEISGWFSLRTRWLSLAAVFYFILVSLMVYSTVQTSHKLMEDIFKDRVKGWAFLAAAQFKFIQSLKGDKLALDQVGTSLSSYPGFEYVILEDPEGKSVWNFGLVSGSTFPIPKDDDLYGKGPVYNKVYEVLPHPSGLLHLEGHLFEISVPVINKAGKKYKLRLCMNSTTINRKAISQIWTSGMIVIFMTMLGIGLVFGMDRSLRKNLNKLIVATNALVEDDTKRVDLKTGDELETLGKSFNTMADKLKGREGELRAVQQTLQSIFDGIDDRITYISKDYEIVMANRAQAEMFAKHPRDMIGRHCWKEFEKRDDVCGHCPGSKAVEDGKIHSVETQGVLHDGRRFIASINAYPVKNDDGKVVGFVEHVQDITARKRMEEELKRHSQKLEELVQARTKELAQTQAQLFQSAKLASLGELVGGVAHEINNPVAIMASRIELLLDELRDVSSPTVQKDLNVLLKQSRRIGGITAKLLAFSRMSPQQKKLKPLPPVIDEAVELLESQLAKRSIRIERNIDKNLPVVLIDSSQLLQVFLNIINNSKDAIDRNGKIQISCLLHHDNGHDWLDVVFDDTGPGIEPSIRDKVFDPFFTTKPLGKGTGLGLSVSYGIVADHGGEIKVSESDAGGARFTVRLPAGNTEDKV